MVNFTITQPSQMTEMMTLFTMLKDWGGTVCLNFDHNGMFIQAMDKSHVGCIDARLTKDWFTKYSVPRERPLWIHTAYLCSVLQSAVKNKLNYVEFLHDAEEPDYLHVFCKMCDVETVEPIMSDNTEAEATAGGDEGGEEGGDATAKTTAKQAENEKKAKGKNAGRGKKKSDEKKKEETASLVPTTAYERHFQLTLVAMSDNDAISIGELDYPVDWVVDKRFINTLFDLNAVGGDINVHCTENMIELSAKGDMGKLSVPIPIDYCVEFSMYEGYTVNATYNLKMLCEMCATTKLTENVAISVGNDLPIRVKYELAGGSTVIFYMAPKVGDEDEDA